MTRPLLVLGWGNRSRGDDALGPLCVERLQALSADDTTVEYLDDYQLMIEHALDLAGRSRVLLVDASRSAVAPFETTAIHAGRDASLGSHAMSPQALLHVYRELYDAAPPPCTLLAVRGEQFALGTPPSLAALAHLDAAVHWAHGWLAMPLPRLAPA
jgi:hydrogenase maturation protease